MISVQKAYDIVLDKTPVLGNEQVALQHTLKRILAEDIYSDINMPPFDRAMMDGYAVRAADTANAPVNLKNIGFIAAGSVADFELQAGECAKIMTGAPLPKGADAVRQVELVESVDGETVRILESVLPTQNISPFACEVAEGDKVLTSGSFINPAVIGLLASQGKTHVQVKRQPSIMILATGDELVEPAVKPKPGHIRNSNSYALAALCAQMGLQAELLGIARDTRESVRDKIKQGLQADVLLISGGVSMGDLDFVPEIFKELNLAIHFEKVAIKPGKPTVFAGYENGIVFGLPGNPISGTTIFEVLVKPALRKMQGYPTYHNQYVEAQLVRDFKNNSGREAFHPAKTWIENGRLFVEPLNTKGSADVASYTKCNALLNCPLESKELKAGAMCKVLFINEFTRADA